MSPNLLIDSTKSLVLMVDEKKLTFFIVSGDKFIRNVYNEKNEKIFCIKLLNFPVVFQCLFCFLSIVNVIKQVCQQHDTINEFVDIFNPVLGRKFDDWKS